MVVASLRRACLVLLVTLIAGGPSLLRAQESALADFPKLSAEADWPWWRGPTRNGVASTKPVPTELSDTQNVVWKTKVPGRGHSSPTVVGQRIFLTTADERAKVHSVLGFERQTGKQLWQTEANRGGFPARNHPHNTEATPTVASDGERLFACFYHHDQVEILALDFDGKILWRKKAGNFRPQRYEYGYAPSPVIYKNTVIVTGEYDGDSFITALDRQSGDEVWRTPRPSNITFSTPVVAPLGGKELLLLSGGQKLSAFDPRTGKPAWSAPASATATCGTVVWDGGVAFASGGYPQSETAAIKGDGSGTLVWKNNQKCYEQSLMAYNGHVYAYNDNGVLVCWRASDGKEMWKQRLGGKPSASPVVAGGHIYWANEGATLYVFKPNPAKLEIVAENKVGDDAFPSPSICGGQIFLRVGQGSGGGRQEWLYCLADK